MASGKRVLLVDDDITLADMYAERLKTTDLAVTVVHDGEAAMEAIKKEKPHIILLDIMMPKMNGFDVAKNLKADPETAGIPIIFLTALIQDTDKTKAMTAEGSTYLVKSETTPGELVERVQKIVSGGPDHIEEAGATKKEA